MMNNFGAFDDLCGEFPPSTNRYSEKKRKQHDGKQEKSKSSKKKAFTNYSSARVPRGMVISSDDNSDHDHGHTRRASSSPYQTRPPRTSFTPLFASVGVSPPSPVPSNPFHNDNNNDDSHSPSEYTLSYQQEIEIFRSEIKLFADRLNQTATNEKQRNEYVKAQGAVFQNIVAQFKEKVNSIDVFRDNNETILELVGM